MHKIYKKVVLVILDGFGVASIGRGNAIALADPKTINFFVSKYPSLTLQSSGPLVGLPWGEMGNSEVGHLNIGAGRIVSQDLPRINKAIETGEFFTNPSFIKACDHVIQNNSALHIMGMISSGGVHSFDEHAYALLGLARERGLTKVYIHMFTDGRDTAERVALDTVAKLRNRIAQIGVGEIATITGRFYAMDRGGHWSQSELTYKAIVDGVGETATSAEIAIQDNYSKGVFDEMIKPTVITKSEGSTAVPVGKVLDNDAVIFINFRQDRALQLTQCFVAPDQTKLKGLTKRNNIFFVTMTEYAANLPVSIAFATLRLYNTLPQVIAKAGLKQFHIAESEKYAHVTSFFNGGDGSVVPGEERVIVRSPSNSNNYSDNPAMSSDRLTEQLVNAIVHSDYNLYVANFANTDMVGHTGNLDSTVKAVEAVDKNLAKIAEAVLSIDACLIITADHGNAEQMINPHSGEIDKDHTTNPVPFLLIAKEFEFQKTTMRGYVDLSGVVPEGIVSDVAPTVLALMGLPKPPDMSAINLITVATSQNSLEKV